MGSDSSVYFAGPFHLCVGCSRSACCVMCDRYLGLHKASHLNSLQLIRHFMHALYLHICTTTDPNICCRGRLLCNNTTHAIMPSPYLVCLVTQLCNVAGSWWITVRITAGWGERCSAVLAEMDLPTCERLILEAVSPASLSTTLSVQIDLCTTGKSKITTILHLLTPAGAWQ